MPVFESSFDDPLGMWAAAPAAQPVSFAVGEAPAPPEADVYRVNLSAQPEEARAELRQNEAAVVAVSAALDAIPARLEDLSQRTPPAGISFAVSGGMEESGPEGELLVMLGETDRQALSGGVLSFGFGEQASQVWAEAKARFDGLMTQIDHDVLHLAWVETNIEQHLIARTIVNWDGDAQTAWLEEAGDEQAGLHERALRSVTQTRLLRLRMFITIASGAARLSVLMAAPGGAVLALPAVYQYVTKILAQAREMQSIQTN